MKVAKTVKCTNMTLCRLSDHLFDFRW